MMTLQKLASMTAKLEGHKVQVSIGNVREVIKCLCVLEAALRVQRALDLKLSPKSLSSASGVLHTMSIDATKKARLGYRKEVRRRKAASKAFATQAKKELKAKKKK